MLRRALLLLWREAPWRPLLLINTVAAGVFAAVEIAFPVWVVAASGSNRLMAALASCFDYRAGLTRTLVSRGRGA